MARIKPEELRKKLDAGEEVMMVDLHGRGDGLRGHQGIPGAVCIDPHRLGQHDNTNKRTTTITGVTRILVLALFFISVVDFGLDSAVRSRGYDRSTRDLLIGRTAEPLNVGRALRCALATALLQIAGRPGASCAPPDTLVICGRSD
jgi:hypothetical protein